MLPPLVAIILIACAFALGRASTGWRWLQPADTSLSTDALDRMLVPPDTTERIPMNGERLFALIFLIAWIVGWSAGIVMATGFFIASFGKGFVTVFLGAWLVGAIAGWFHAALTIYKLATGKPVRNRGREI